MTSRRYKLQGVHTFLVKDIQELDDISCLTCHHTNHQKSWSIVTRKIGNLISGSTSSIYLLYLKNIFTDILSLFIAHYWNLEGRREIIKIKTRSTPLKLIVSLINFHIGTSFSIFNCCTFCHITKSSFILEFGPVFHVSCLPAYFASIYFIYT